MKSEYELIVVGGGMAGLTAGARAATAGTSVLVVESGEDVGGSTRYAGYVWTAPTYEVMDAENPGGDVDLRHALVDGFAEGVEWIASLGVEIGQEQRILDFGGRGHAFDTNQYVELCRQQIVERGGDVLLRSEVTELIVDDGAVTGAVVSSGGAQSSVASRYVLLATGGFQGDPEMRRRLMGEAEAAMPLRSNPRSTGAGYRLAESVDAATGFDDAGFYGHLIPSNVDFTDEDFVAMSLYSSEHSILINLDGERFVDETIGDHISANALAAQRESRALMVFDERVYNDWVLTSYVDGAVAVDKLTVASKRGGRVGKADTLDEFEYLPEEWGYNGAAVVRAVEQFNAEVGTDALAPGRLRDQEKLLMAPYFVIETIPAITFPFHGVRIDAQARVLNAAGTPIPGLLAAGSDTGGLWKHAYAGGLASALVFGSAAARTVSAGG